MHLKREECILLGTLVKTHSFNGELVLKASFPLADEFENLESVFLLINGILVPFFMEEIIISNEKTAILKFEDVNSKDEADKLRGKSVFIQDSDQGLLIFKPDQTHNFTGYELWDENHQKVGVVKELIDIANNPLFVVDLEEGEIMVPANSELFIEVNSDRKILIIQIPEGLISLD